ncbi:MAG: hypothetical protein RR420_08585, partial [Anaerovoracaceae bacterium]
MKKINIIAQDETYSFKISTTKTADFQLHQALQKFTELLLKQTLEIFNNVSKEQEETFLSTLYTLTKTCIDKKTIVETSINGGKLSYNLKQALIAAKLLDKDQRLEEQRYFPVILEIQEEEFHFLELATSKGQEEEEEEDKIHSFFVFLKETIKEIFSGFGPIAEGIFTCLGVLGILFLLFIIIIPFI